MPKPLYPHYAFTNPASIHDEEALTALELAGRLGAKMNEVVSAVNNINTANQEFSQNVEKELDDVKGRFEEMALTLDHEVAGEIIRHIQSGFFDQHIDEYAGGLIAKVQQLIENNQYPETASAAELVDARAGVSGLVHASTGEHLRSLETSVNSIAKGVYEIPQTWKFMENYNLFNGTAFMLPESGVSLRILERFDIDVDGTSCRLMVRPQVGRLVNGKFQQDATVMEAALIPGYTGRIVYIPYQPDVCILPQASVLSGSTVKLNATVADAVAAELHRVKVYAGKVENGGNFLGVHPLSATSSTTEGISATFGMKPYGTKFMALGTVLPLEWVHRVTCSPRYWMCAKVYEYNPATQSHKFVKSLNVHNDAPCRGTACEISFSDYGANMYAVLLMGRVPLNSEYNGDSYNGTNFHENETLLGLNLTGHLNHFNVEWVKKEAVADLLGVGSDIPRQNLELLKGLRHNTDTGLFARDSYPDDPMNFIPAVKNFAGIQYGGDFKGGTFFYNVSPRAYYTALMNPNSCAYGEKTLNTDCMKYGIVCAPFTSLVHGHEYPASTFSIRYFPELTGFTTEPLNLREDMGDLKKYDVLTYGNGYSGHSVVLTDLYKVDDVFTSMRFAESIHPATAETLNPFHNGAPFASYENPENGLFGQYGFVSRAVKGSGSKLHDRATWEVPYNGRQPLMCNRGYGGLYILGHTEIKLSLALWCQSFRLRHVDTNTERVISVGTGENLPKVNDFHIYDLTPFIDKPGQWVMTNDTDVTPFEEMFYVVAAPVNTAFNITRENNRVKCTVPNNATPYYAVVTYVIKTGDHAGEYPSVIVPVVNGQIDAPDKFTTDIGECEYAATVTRPITCVYKSGYDSNTYAISSNGAVFV